MLFRSEQTTVGCLKWGDSAANIEATVAGLSNLNVGDVRVTRSGDGASITEQQKLTVTASDTVQNGASGFYRIKFTHGVQKPLVVTAIDHANTDQLTVVGHRYLEGAKVTLSTVTSLPPSGTSAFFAARMFSHASTAQIPSFSRIWSAPVPNDSSPQMKGV